MKNRRSPTHMEQYREAAEGRTYLPAILAPALSPSVGAWLGVALLTVGTVTTGGIHLGVYERWPAYTIATVTVLTAAFLLWASAPFITRPARVASLVTAVVVSVIVTFGALTSVVIDGQVYAATSLEARTQKLLVSLYDDFTEIAAFDKLLATDIASARPWYNNYAPAAIRMREIAAFWAAYPLVDLPDTGFIDAIQHIKVAGLYGSVAMEHQASLLIRYDAVIEQQAIQNRAVYVEAVLSGGAVLSDIAIRNQLPLADPELGE